MRFYKGLQILTVNLGPLELVKIVNKVPHLLKMHTSPFVHLLFTKIPLIPGIFVLLW
jgi:hypothetical protein